MHAEPVEVRPATPGDAVGIARAHVDSWRETYAPLVPPGALDDLDVEARAERWAEIITTDEGQLWVATRADRIVGFCGIGPGRGDDAPRDLELNAIYLLADEHGHGLGQALLDAALADRPAFLWVAADNPRAHAFYRRNRFDTDGATREHTLAGHPIRIVRFVR